MTGVPTVITDLSATAASNSPAGSDAIGNSLDNYLRAGFAFTRQMFDTGIIWAGTATGVDTIAITASPIPTAYKTGQGYAFLSAGANTGAVTINANSLGAKNLYQNGTTAFVGGEIPGAGVLVVAVYDGTQFQIANLPATANANPFSDANALVKGSSDATKLFRIEVDGNTSGTTRVMTPPDANFTAVGTATTQTLTNKTIDASANTLSNITESMLSTSDVTTNNATSSKHGFLPKLSNVATDVLLGTGSFGAAPFTAPTATPTSAISNPLAITVDFTTYAVYDLVLSGVTSDSPLPLQASSNGGGGYTDFTITGHQIAGTGVSSISALSVFTTGTLTIRLYQPSTSGAIYATVIGNSRSSGTVTGLLAQGVSAISAAANRIRINDNITAGSYSLIPVAKR